MTRQYMVREGESPVYVDTATANVVYEGYPIPYSAVTDATWAIKKIYNTDGAGLWKFAWANGDTIKNKIWNNRDSLTYVDIGL